MMKFIFRSQRCKRTISAMFAVVSLHCIAQEEQKPTAITHVRLFDGKKIVSDDIDVLFKDQILGIGKALSIPKEAMIIDGRGKTLMPGLIDAHVHVFTEQTLKQVLIFGVTTVIDMFTDVSFVKSMKAKESEGKDHDFASLISSGTLATAPGGHGTEYGLPISTLTSPLEAQAFVDARIEEGSDFIKIILDDGKSYSSELPTLDRETLTALIRAAHRREKLAVVHVVTLKDAIIALEAGADGLAHLYCDDAFDPNFAILAAKQKSFVIPTMTVLQSICGVSDIQLLMKEAHLAPYLTQNDILGLNQKFPFQHAHGDKGYRAAERAIVELKGKKVPILAGTDAPNPGTAYGASLHRELELLVRAGLTAEEALRAATSLPAEKFSIKDRGYVRKGLAADLLLVNGNPTKDILATRDIAAVWKRGFRADRAAYKSGVEQQKEAAEKLKTMPMPEGSESGLISDFEQDKVTALFGAGWSISTDAVVGGKSKVHISRDASGAGGSDGCLLIAGEILTGSPNPWAGAFFSPGKAPMAPANLSDKKAISFWARGEGKIVAIMIFAQSLGWMPAIRTFIVGQEWEKHTIPFEKFGTDGHDIMGIFFGASMIPGSFTLRIDDVRLVFE